MEQEVSRQECTERNEQEVSGQDSEEEGFCLADTLAASPPSTPLEDRLDLSDSIRALPDSERRLIDLRYYKNLTQTETAKRLGLSQVQVCRMEKRILLALRQKIR